MAGYLPYRNSRASCLDCRRRNAARVRGRELDFSSPATAARSGSWKTSRCCPNSVARELAAHSFQPCWTRPALGRRSGFCSKSEPPTSRQSAFTAASGFQLLARRATITGIPTEDALILVHSFNRVFKFLLPGSFPVLAFTTPDFRLGGAEMNVPVREQLLASSEEFRKLAKEHSNYSQRLESLANKKYLSEEEKIEEIRLKKLKLRLKDEMESFRPRTPPSLLSAAASGHPRRAKAWRQGMASPTNAAAGHPPDYSRRCARLVLGKRCGALHGPGAIRLASLPPSFQVCSNWECRSSLRSPSSCSFLPCACPAWAVAA